MKHADLLTLFDATLRPMPPDRWAALAPLFEVLVLEALAHHPSERTAARRERDADIREAFASLGDDGSLAERIRQLAELGYGEISPRQLRRIIGA